MKKQIPSFKWLRPFGEEYSRFEAEITALLGRVPESELDALIAECEQVTDANCWWAIFAVAPLVERLAKERLDDD